MDYAAQCRRIGIPRRFVVSEAYSGGRFIPKNAILKETPVRLAVRDSTKIGMSRGGYRAIDCVFVSLARWVWHTLRTSQCILVICLLTILLGISPIPTNLNAPIFRPIHLQIGLIVIHLLCYRSIRTVCISRQGAHISPIQKPAMATSFATCFCRLEFKN